MVELDGGDNVSWERDDKAVLLALGSAVAETSPRYTPFLPCRQTPVSGMCPSVSIPPGCKQAGPQQLTGDWTQTCPSLIFLPMPAHSPLAWAARGGGGDLGEKSHSSDWRGEGCWGQEQPRSGSPCSVHPGSLGNEGLTHPQAVTRRKQGRPSDQGSYSTSCSLETKGSV